jgi:ATP-dependent helicase/nuclease subunit A
MSSPRNNVPDQVRARQAAASNPDTTVFVSANAGSGKTYVLVARVIRLMLNGVAPEKILCITFTKAAAANMAQRVFERLGHWVTLPDDELDIAIAATGASQPNDRTRSRARELFAQALETPGGLKVQTIHALCTRLLQQFPFEANVPAHFTVLDERDQTEMMERANLSVLLDAAASPDSHTGWALRTAMAGAADQTFQEVVQEACLSRDKFMAWAESLRDAADAAAQIARALNIAADEEIELVDADITNGPHMPVARWANIADALEKGSKTDQDRARVLHEALAESGSDRVERYLSLFLDSKNKLRESLITKTLAKMTPELADLTNLEIQRIDGLIKKRRAVLTRDRTRALHAIATSVSDHYRREKQERGLLDYHDLIEKTHAMLANKGGASWVQYKLDGGIDHVLIDEAQDTSPKQWDIITNVIADFTTGKGAHDGVKRTLFAVGDEKQSIFSFQGAAPREFDERRRDFQGRFEAANLGFATVPFNYSFRSGQGVLDAVTSTFKTQAVYGSITTDTDGMPAHLALEDAAPSVIDLWNLEQPPEKAAIEGWRAPFDARPESDPIVVLALRVQSEIKSLVTSGTLTGTMDRRRPLRYGDILVLVRRRSGIFDAVIQALKHAGIPVAGADRLKLTEHIAVIDLMNLADALLLPQDDLALAVVLKSPIFGLNDEDLLKFAPMRGHVTLREAFENYAEADLLLQPALKRLQACEQRFAYDRPFEFFAWLLGGEGGRALILKRLGPESNDALDEFLELALTYERKSAASLQGFMAWLRAADTEIKRDMEIKRDEVRVMTAHGAKGLEASVVFLVDTATSPVDTTRMRLIHLPLGNAAPNTPGVTVWAGRKADDPDIVAQARANMLTEVENEYRRLLYVAMTRAADRLIVGGCQPGNVRDVKPTSWYGLIREGLASSSLLPETIDTPHGPVTRYMRAEDAAHLRISSSTEPDQPDLVTGTPDWLRVKAPGTHPDTMRLRPSDDGQDFTPEVSNETSNDRARALQRGTLVHRLLQSLPDVSQERRRDVATAFLARHASDQMGWSDEERAKLATQVMTVMDDARFRTLFGDGSRAEVSIAGRLMGPDGSSITVSGQVDRLIVTPDEIRIVDFKTNLRPPRGVVDTPPAYLRQLAIYRAVLTTLYPGKRVTCALLWTETASIMEIPPSLLDTAFMTVAA